MTSRSRHTTTKSDLARQAAETCGLSIKVAERVIDAAIDGIWRAVRAGNRVELRKFGVFEQKKQKARRIVSMGREMHTKAGTKLAFKTAREMRDLEV